jgi:hypothetical protein
MLEFQIMSKLIIGVHALARWSSRFRNMSRNELGRNLSVHSLQERANPVEA